MEFVGIDKMYVNHTTDELRLLKQAVVDEMMHLMSLKDRDAYECKRLHHAAINQVLRTRREIEDVIGGYAGETFTQLELPFDEDMTESD